MSGRILLFGATGYTGRLTAERLVRSGTAPVLVGRNATAVAELANELADLAPAGRKPDTAVADATEIASLHEIVTDPDDVVISTVGPFAKFGGAAVSAAIHAGCAYVDSSGEPTFLQDLFENYQHKARRTGARLLPAMGYDYAPGNLAGALLLDQAATPVTRMDIAYLVRGPYGPSAGTLRTSTGIALEPSYTLKNGEVTAERPGAKVRSFELDGKRRDAISIGGSEQFTLPKIAALQDLNVYVGWTGKWSRAASAAGLIASNALTVPGVGSAMSRVLRTALGPAGPAGSGPGREEREKAESVVIAESVNAAGETLDRVELTGPNPYDLTGDLLCWSARMLSRRAEKEYGVLGPVTAFGLEAYVAGCTALGLLESR